MRTLAITPIWPNRLDPTKATYNAQQFRELSRKVTLRVLNNVLYFPLAGRTGVPKRAAKIAPLPHTDRVEGVETWHVRQPYIPKLSNALAVPLALGALGPYVRHVRWADVILGTWAYPDGCAAVILAQLFDKPCVVKVHGSDINVISHMRAARGVMASLLPKTDAMVAVSRALAGEIASLGVDRERITVVANGVDSDLFHPRDRAASRAALDQPASGKLLVFVGRLEPAKGVTELLDAFARLREKRADLRLAMIGEGDMRKDVEALADKMPKGTIVAPGERSFGEVAQWMGASDLVVLPSWREGTPNVLLEALASGRACVGSNVGGIPDVLADPRSGLVHEARDTVSLTNTLEKALDRSWPVDEVRASGPGSWAESAERLYEVLCSAIERHRNESRRERRR